MPVADKIARVRRRSSKRPASRAASACSSFCPTCRRSRGSSSERSRPARSSRWATPTCRPKSIEYLVEYTRATAIVTVPKVAKRRVSTLPKRGARDLDGARRADREDDTEVGDLSRRAREHRTIRAQTAAATHRDEPAIWLFTSGSTGEPKANVHAHRDFAFNTEVYAKSTVGYRAGRRHRQRAAFVFRLRDGHEPHVPVRRRRDRRPLQRAAHARVARARDRDVPARPSSPTSRRCSASSSSTTPRCATKGEAGLDLSCDPLLALRRRGAARSRSSRAGSSVFASDVYDGIGSAEMFHIYASNRPGDVKPGSLGKAVEGYELRILPEDADRSRRDAECAPGEIGVLWVKGDSVSHRLLARSRQELADASTATGAARAISSASTTQGYLYFAGRADELLKVSGLWVAPVEVEECLMRHEAVALAAVIGVEEEGLDEDEGVRRRARGSRRERRALERRSRSSRRRASRSTSTRASSSSSTTCRRTIAARSTARRSARADSRDSAGGHASQPRQPRLT